MRWVRRGLLVGMFVVALLSSALTVAMALSSAIFSAVSSVVELVFDGPTLRRKQDAELTALRRQLDDEVVSSKALRRDLTRTAAERDRFARELAERTVPYRGSTRPLREAVADTSERIGRRLAAGATRTVASTAGEALPLVGVGVVAAAAAYELYDACEMMKDLHALDVAFNPDNAISEREVCGMRAPASEEIWATVKTSPSAAWSTATGYYENLAAVDVGAMLGSAYGWIIAWNPWADAAEPLPAPEAEPLPHEEHAGTGGTARP